MLKKLSGITQDFQNKIKDLTGKERDKNGNFNQTKSLPEDFPQQLFHYEMEVENDPVNLEDVNNLLQLYATAVEYYESVKSDRFQIFKNKTKALLIKPNVLKAMGQQHADRESPTDQHNKDQWLKQSSPIKMNLKQQEHLLNLQQQLNQQDTNESAKMILNKQKQEIQNNINLIENDVKNQTENIKIRLQQRKQQNITKNGFFSPKYAFKPQTNSENNNNKDQLNKYINPNKEQMQVNLDIKDKVQNLNLLELELPQQKPAANADNQQKNPQEVEGADPEQQLKNNKLVEIPLDFDNNNEIEEKAVEEEDVDQNNINQHKIIYQQQSLTTLEQLFDKENHYKQYINSEVNSTINQATDQFSYEKKVTQNIKNINDKQLNLLVFEQTQNQQLFTAQVGNQQKSENVQTIDLLGLQDEPEDLYSLANSGNKMEVKPATPYICSQDNAKSSSIIYAHSFGIQHSQSSLNIKNEPIIQPSQILNTEEDIPHTPIKSQKKKSSSKKKKIVTNKNQVSQSDNKAMNKPQAFIIPF